MHKQTSEGVRPIDSLIRTSVCGDTWEATGSEPEGKEEEEEEEVENK